MLCVFWNIFWALKNYIFVRKNNIIVQFGTMLRGKLPPLDVSGAGKLFEECCSPEEEKLVTFPLSPLTDSRFELAHKNKKDPIDNPRGSCLATMHLGQLSDCIVHTADDQACIMNNTDLCDTESDGLRLRISVPKSPACVNVSYRQGETGTISAKKTFIKNWTFCFKRGYFLIYGGGGN
jgi:hypothetical protein